MRHFYFRLFFGIVWLAAALVSAGTFAALYVVLGIVFLGSAYLTRKKERDKGDER